MQFIEHKKTLPEGLLIPKLRSGPSLQQEAQDPKSSIPNYDDRETYWGHLTSGHLSVFNNKDTREIKDPEDLFSLVRENRHTFIIMPLAWHSILWKGFSDDFRRRITQVPHLGAKWGPYSVKSEVPRKFTIRNGNKYHFLWVLSLRDFLITKKQEYSMNPEDLTTQFLDTMPKLTGIKGNPMSMAATGRDFIFGYVDKDYDLLREEFSLTRRLSEVNFEVLEDIYSACKRPLMDANCLGDIPPGYNEDMKRAYLGAFGEAPSMSLTNNVINNQAFYDPEASHAVYLVEVVMPNSWVFAPNIFRGGDDTEGYGTYGATGGPQVQRIGQLRANSWTYLGIPFKVLKAYKVIPLGGTLFPWKRRAQRLNFILDTYKKELPLINLKSLYTNSLGSLMQYYWQCDNNGEDHAVGSPLFNPLLQLFIYEWVSIYTWSRLQAHPPHTHQALRIDAASILDYPQYKKDPRGLFIQGSSKPYCSFYPNPREKDKNTIEDRKYRDAVEEANKKNEKEVYLKSVVVGTLPMLLNEQITEEQYGRRITNKTLINLGGEGRIPEGGNRPIHPGELLDNRVPLFDIPVERIQEAEEIRPESKKYRDED